VAVELVSLVVRFEWEHEHAELEECGLWHGACYAPACLLKNNILLENDCELKFYININRQDVFSLAPLNLFRR